MKIIEVAVAAGILPQEFIDNLKNRKCPVCGADVSKANFRDELSLKEFTISGMCQECQDKVFGVE